MEEKDKSHIPVDENDEKQRDIVTTFAAGEAAKPLPMGLRISIINHRSTIEATMMMARLNIG